MFKSGILPNPGILQSTLCLLESPPWSLTGPPHQLSLTSALGLHHSSNLPDPKKEAISKGVDPKGASLGKTQVWLLSTKYLRTKDGSFRYWVCLTPSTTNLHMCSLTPLHTAAKWNMSRDAGHMCVLKYHHSPHTMTYMSTRIRTRTRPDGKYSHVPPEEYRDVFMYAHVCPPRCMEHRSQ